MAVGLRKTTLIVVAVGSVVASFPSAAFASGSAEPVLEGLDGPRGVAVGPAGRVVFAEADGTFSQLTTKGKNAGSVDELGSVLPGFAAALDVGGRGQTYIVTGGGGPEGEAPPGGATLFRWNPGANGTVAVKNIAAYQEHDPDPFNIEGMPEESNPFGVAALPDGSALVSDAAGNDLIRVYPDGHAVTVARIMPRVVPVPEELPDEVFGEPIPPAGTPIPSEGVATSVTVGADGYYYVGELRGFPATPGTSQVWRIAPDSVDAVCDPENPDEGACQRYADGFTSVVDLAAGPDGSIYVLELATDSWLQLELGIGSPFGALMKIPSGGGAPVELAAGQLILPGGVDVGVDGDVYVTGPVFGPGALMRISE